MIRSAIFLGLLVMGAFAAQNAVAEDAPDPSKCFNSMLQEHYDFSQRESLLLSALSMLSKTQYDDAKKKGTFTAVLPDVGLFDGEYTDYQTKLSQLFQYNRLDVNSYKETLLSATWVGDRGYQVIEKCLDDIYQESDGFRWKVEYLSPLLVSIQFGWSSSLKGEDEIELLDSQLLYGHVDGVPPGKLFQSPDEKHGSLKVGRASVPIFVFRNSEADSIFINLTTSLAKQPGTIRIKPVPEEKPLLWKPFIREMGPDGKPIPHQSTQEIRADKWTLTLKPSPGFEFAEEPTCSINTQYPIENVHILAHDWDQSANSFSCSGTQNANPRFIDFHWTQGKREEKCLMHCGNLPTQAVGRK